MREFVAKLLKVFSDRLWQVFIYYSETAKKYCRISILDGLKYIAVKNVTICEKLFFFVLLAIIFSNFLYLEKTVIEKWKTSPLLTVINPRATFISNEPFPAITICNMNKLQRSKVKDFDVKSLEYVMTQNICDQKINYSQYEHIYSQYKNNSLPDFLLKNTQPCSEMLVACKFGDIKRTCSDLFREILLDEGVCCTFNVVHPFMMIKGNYLMVQDYTEVDGITMALNWSTEEGYPRELPKSYYPRPPMGPGLSNGLSVILNGDVDNYHCSSTDGEGFKVSVHNPIETSNIKEHAFIIAMGEETNLRIKVLKEETDISLRSTTSPLERLCYFSDEYSLAYFRYYSQNNCELECDAAHLERKCNCLPYYMPEMSINYTDCYIHHFDCVTLVEENFLDPITLKCKKKCLPNCNELSYSATRFAVPLSNHHFGITSKFLYNKSRLEEYSILNVYFPNNYHTGYIKITSMSFTDLLSHIGGTLSLMMGFSVIFLVEIAHFFVIKPFIAWWHYVMDNTVHVTPISSFPDNKNQNRRRLALSYALARKRMLPSTENIEQFYYLD